MIRSTDYLSAVDRFNALATMRKAAGLDDSVASAIRQIDALRSGRLL